MPVNQIPQIQTLPAKIFAGFHSQTTLVAPQAPFLWHKLMPKRNSIPNRVGQELFSLQMYVPGQDFSLFKPNTPFEQWAAVEVSSAESLLEGMEVVHFPGGLYLTHVHKGTRATFPETMRFLFAEWLPGSEFSTDDRPHVGVFFENHHPEDPEAEETLWIPIKPRG